MEQSTTKTERRDSAGLTRTDRGLLRDPARYLVTRTGEGWTVTHLDVPVEFTATRVPGSRDSLWVFSGTSGLTYRTSADRCSCPDHERAVAQGRPCKHQAVVISILNDCARKRLAARAEASHQALADHVAAQERRRQHIESIIDRDEPQVVGHTASGGSITLTTNPNPPTAAMVISPDLYAVALAA